MKRFTVQDSNCDFTHSQINLFALDRCVAFSSNEFSREKQFFFFFTLLARTSSTLLRTEDLTKTGHKKQTQHKFATNYVRGLFFLLGDKSNIRKVKA